MDIVERLKQISDHEPVTFVSAKEIQAVVDELSRLRSDNERMREALEFYANPEIYKPHPHGPAFDRRDLGLCARSALSQGQGGE